MTIGAKGGYNLLTSGSPYQQIKGDSPNGIDFVDRGLVVPLAVVASRNTFGISDRVPPQAVPPISIRGVAQFG